MSGLTVKQVEDITDTIIQRQQRFQEELRDSIMVVLFNYGDKFTEVACLDGEWRGMKGDLQPRDGVPFCPNGHVLLETSRGRRLELV